MTLIGSRAVLIILIGCSLWLTIKESIPFEAEHSVSPYRIQLRTASVVELEILPGIGSVAAQRIIEYRQDHEVLRPEDLLGIYRIGPKTIDQLRHLVADEVAQ